MAEGAALRVDHMLPAVGYGSGVRSWNRSSATAGAWANARRSVAKPAESTDGVSDQGSVMRGARFTGARTDRADTDAARAGGHGAAVTWRNSLASRDQGMHRLFRPRGSARVRPLAVVAHEFAQDLHRRSEGTHSSAFSPTSCTARPAVARLRRYAGAVVLLGLPRQVVSRSGSGTA